MIEIRLDSTEGPVIGSISILPTGGMDIYKQMSCRIKNAKGVHDLYFCFKGEKETNSSIWIIGNLNSFL